MEKVAAVSKPVYEPTLGLGEWDGGRVSDWVTCVRADNPGHMTLDGTNTWIVTKPGSGRALIVDPGPADEAHWLNVAAALTGVGVDPAAGVAAILITHHHGDHTEGIDLFADATGAPVYARAPEHCRGGGEINFDDEQTPVALSLGEVAVELLPAPGHTRDSIAIVVPEAEIIFSGDTILGRGTTVVAYPDGNLGQYLDSLQRIRNLVVGRELELILPGHGPTISRPLDAIDFYLAHRQERLAQVQQCLKNLDTPTTVTDELANQVVQIVYADVPEHLWPAATRSVLAQLEYLATN